MENKTFDQQRMATYRDFVGELTAVYKRTKMPMVKVSSSKDAAEFLKGEFDMCMDDHEEFKVLHLNTANGVVNLHHAAKGQESSCHVDIKDIMRHAILIKTKGIILAHNHPSGRLKPSQSDINLTKNISKAAELFNIKVLDHIILTRESYYSFADEGLL